MADVEAAVRRTVGAINRDDMETWCRSVYIANDNDPVENEFLPSEGTFEDMPAEQQESCVRQKPFADQPDLEQLRITKVDLRGRRRAIASVEFLRGSERVEGKWFLRRIEGRWLVQFPAR